MGFVTSKIAPRSVSSRITVILTGCITGLTI
jgi:hypothetical protein